MNKPTIAIPLGDPAGVGPEIIVKSLSELELYKICNPIVIGDNNILRNALKICNKTTEIHLIDSPQEYKINKINLIDLNNIRFTQFGTVQAICGQAAYEYIATAVKLAIAGEVDAIATTPINKESLNAAKINHIGHTEILAELTQTKDPLTMFEVRGMRVFFLSRHVSLRQACDIVTKKRVLEYIIRCHKALVTLGIIDSKIAVAGLNPHSGDNGLFGTEEIEQIEPAIKEAKKLGYDVVGPIGADSVFHQALQGKYDAVLSLYHDQGHIATKTLDFEKTIAITIGLPFLRTSVDHGTAFDIAGKGIVSAVSMTEAIRLAAKYSKLYATKYSKLYSLI
ncbi:MAG: 4-hydroxythreonine-4-phosphate dehydrogenase PdxA [Proteobacteria bacterium]|nr:4-hydroxythreonine-4-phosphate dehydrogenase PdxA [Pseudomonadota bacterium]